MIKRFFGKSGTFFIMPLITISVLFACAQPDQQSGRLVGGPCQYKSYPGHATILSITDGQTDDHDKIKRYNVKFSFTPQGKIEEDFAQVEGKTFNLDGNNFQYPDHDFLNTHNIHVGKVLDGSVQVITSGTCTPVWFDFSTLKQGK